MRALITGYCALKSNEGNMNFEISFDFIVFETERLLLREFNTDDVDAVYAYAGDAENTIYMDPQAVRKFGILFNPALHNR